MSVTDYGLNSAIEKLAKAEERKATAYERIAAALEQYVRAATGQPL